MIFGKKKLHKQYDGRYRVKFALFPIKIIEPCREYYVWLQEIGVKEIYDYEYSWWNDNKNYKFYFHKYLPDEKDIESIHTTGKPAHH